MNTKSSLAEELRNKEYRDAFVASQTRIALPMQCRALRESRSWTQPQLAEAAGMTQPRISEIERPGERKLTLETLLRLASAFDVALQVRFIPFSVLVDEVDSFEFDKVSVLPFDKDIARLERIEEQMKSVTMMPQHGQSSAINSALVNGAQKIEGKAVRDAAPINSEQSIGQAHKAQIERVDDACLSSVAS